MGDRDHSVGAEDGDAPPLPPAVDVELEEVRYWLFPWRVTAYLLLFHSQANGEEGVQH